MRESRLLKRGTILLHWSIDCKTYKCNCILFRGQVQGYRIGFTKEEVSVREALLTAAHLGSAMEATQFRAHWVNNTEQESQTIRHLCFIIFIICKNSL